MDPITDKPCADATSDVEGKPTAEAGRWRPALRWILGCMASQRIGPVWMLPAALLAVFAAFRVGLVLVQRDALASADGWDVARSFLVGLRYDAVVLGYGMIPLVVVMALAPNLAFRRAWFRRAIVVCATLFFVLAITIGTVGAYFFDQFHSRLNWIALDYWEHIDEVAAYVWGEYPVWIVPMASSLAAIGGYLLFRWAFWRGRRPTGPIWPRPILATALIGICVMAARGSFGHHRMRFGPAYFSANRIVAQLALNDFFTLGEAYKCRRLEHRGLASYHEMPPPETTWRVTREMLGQADSPFVGAPDNPLWRREATSRPRRDYNVVVVVMEGMSGRPVGALGIGPSYTPHLDRLCEQGLFFDRMYGVGDRTCRGLIGILCGHPDLASRSVMKRSRAQGTFLTLPLILKRRGYRTLFLFGGDPDFDNMKGFFREGGIDRFVDGNDMDPSEPRSIWAVHDEGLYRKANDVFSGLGTEPFFAVIKTSSNHEPFDVPPGRVEMLPTDTVKDRRLNAYRYADWALHEFFTRARKAAYFKNTIFVLIADQGRAVDYDAIIDFRGYHLPCLIYAPGIVQPQRVSAIASQTDVSPTILALLGGSYEHCFMGRNLLAVAPGEGFAFLMDDNSLGFIWDGHALVLPPGGEPLPYRLGPEGSRAIPPEQTSPDQIERARLRALSYINAARELYLRGAYYFPKP